MRKLLFVVAVLLLCAGQMCTGVEAKPDRLEPNDQLREACGGGEDAWFRTELITLNAEREAGIPERDTLEAVNQHCVAASNGSQRAANDCYSCYAAMVRQVYGE